jgi:hypothetical protein
MPWLILFSLCIATFSANSKAQEHPVEQLLKLEIAAYQLSSAFSEYVLFTGASRFSQKLESTIEATAPILTRAKSTYPNIADKLQASLSFIENKKELVYSPDDHRLIIGLATFQNPLYQLINDKKLSLLQDKSKAPTLSPTLHEYLNTRISFERVVAQYISISASSAGFVVSDISIEENVDAFSSRIKNMTNKGAGYQRLNVKWKFIKSNMLKNPGQTSPFITMRTAVDIRKILQSLYKNSLVTNSNF